MESHKLPSWDPLLFLWYIIDLSQFVNNKSTPILFEDNTSILFIHSDTTELNSNTHTVFETINTWFKNNYISLNFGEKKTHCKHLKTRKSQAIDMKIGYNSKLISTVLSTKFLVLTINSTFSCRMHIDHFTTKWSTACNVIRSIKPLISHETLLLIYHSLFHTVRVMQ
jgi:hypothetical protein